MNIIYNTTSLGNRVPINIMGGFSSSSNGDRSPVPDLFPHHFNIWFVSVTALKFWLNSILAKAVFPSDSRPLGYRFCTGKSGGQFFLAVFSGFIRGFLAEAAEGFRGGRRGILRDKLFPSYSSLIMNDVLKSSPDGEDLGGVTTYFYQPKPKFFRASACPFTGQGCGGLDLAYYVWVHRHRPPV